MKNFQTILNESQQQFEQLFEQYEIEIKYPINLSNIKFINFNSYEAKIKINNSMFIIGNDIKSSYFSFVNNRNNKHYINIVEDKIIKNSLAHYFKLDIRGELHKDLMILINNFNEVCVEISKNCDLTK